MVSTSTSAGPCHVAMSECGLVNWTGLAPAGNGDDASMNSKWSLHFKQTVEREIKETLNKMLTVVTIMFKLKTIQWHPKSNWSECVSYM